MKKLTMLLCCLIVLCVLAAPAQAAFNASVSLSPSAATLHRGDSFTVTAVLNNTDAIKLGTVVLSYDTNVFEMTGGTCHVAGANPAQVIPAQKVGTFFVSSETVVSGTVFTFNMKVKDTAAFGSYTISSTASVGVSTGEYISSGSASVSVACNHSYGAWSQVDETNHSRTCSICQAPENAAHGWQAGTVTKQPSCKETGTQEYNCATCGGTKTETLDKTENHSYGNWTNVDSNSHKHICSVCSKEESASHSWNAGTVTKAATCKETGMKTYTCTGCSATKTDEIAKTTTHSYSSWTKVDGANHKHSCSVCGKEETASHSWNAGAVTKAATCKETGMKTYTCTGCSATKTEEIAKTTTHTYGNWAKVNDTTHKHSCSVCGKEETASHSWNAGVVTKAATCKEAGVKTYTCTGCGLTKTEEIAKLTTHTYDHACDTDCNICGQTRTTTHSYNTFWSADKADHWHACSVCGDKKDSAAHTPGVAATESTAQTCTVCGYILSPALGHTHNYAAELTTDENGHWYACSGCNEKKDYADHSFENGCDTLCEACGYTRATSHAYGEDWTSDAQNHWHECAECGEKTDEAAHVPGMEATAEAAQTCTVCGYELAPALEVPETEPTSAPATDEQAPEKASFPWWIVIIAVVLLGGAAAFIGIKKKK